MSDYEKQVLADRDYWRDLAPEGFYLIGFTYRNEASFGFECGSGSIEITSKHVEFFKNKAL